MKNFLLTFLVITLMITGITFADEFQTIRVFENNDFADDTLNVPWEGLTLGIGSELTWTIDFGTKKPDGFGSFQITTSGTGSTAAIVHKSSCNGETFNTTIKDGSVMDDIVSAQTPGAYQYQFGMPFSRYFEISLTVSGAELTIDDVAFNLQ